MLSKQTPPLSSRLSSGSLVGYFIHVKLLLFPDASHTVLQRFRTASQFYWRNKTNTYSQSPTFLVIWTVLCCYQHSTSHSKLPSPSITHTVVLLTGFHNIHPLQVSLPPVIPLLIALYYNSGKLPQPFPYSSKAEKNVLLNCATFISFLAHRCKKSYHWLIQRYSRISNAVKIFLAPKQEKKWSLGWLSLLQ